MYLSSLMDWICSGRSCMVKTFLLTQAAVNKHKKVKFYLDYSLDNSVSDWEVFSINISPFLKSGQVITE